MYEAAQNVKTKLFLSKAKLSNCLLPLKWPILALLV